MLGSTLAESNKAYEQDIAWNAPTDGDYERHRIIASTTATSHTLDSGAKEITKWAIPGRSCFERLMKKHNLTHPEQSPLDEFPPLPASLQLQAASTNLPIISHDKTRTRAGLLALFV